MNELLGGRIKALRSARNFTQEQIAGQLGISRQKYARIENGAGNVTLEVLSRLANILEISVGDITRALEEPSAVEYRTGVCADSTGKIFDMLDLFYANKHLYKKLQQSEIEQE